MKFEKAISLSTYEKKIEVVLSTELSNFACENQILVENRILTTSEQKT